tara:strand:- start:213835 stop:216879 length:3045 start_codon:yes stop_codon:yes gene_type:complete
MIAARQFYFARLNPLASSPRKDRPDNMTKTSLPFSSNIFDRWDAAVSVIEWNASDQKIILVNPAYSLLTGYSSSEVIGQHCRFLQHDDHLQPGSDGLNRAMALGESTRAISRNYRKDGSMFWNEVTLSPMRGDDGKITHFLEISVDVTSDQSAPRNGSEYADQHATTKIHPDKLLLSERLHQSMHRADTESNGAALIFLDVDLFKSITDNKGPQFGNALLNAIFQRLHYCLNASDTLACCDHDEFAIILNNAFDASYVDSVMKKISEAIALPFFIQGQAVRITCSSGIALYPQHASDWENLFQYAHMALYVAKQNGPGAHRFFDTEMNVRVKEREILEDALRDAIPNREMTLHYQPVISLQTGAIIALEALIRWTHPVLGIVPPFRFIPIAENTDMIDEIGAVIDAQRPSVSNLRFGQISQMQIVSVDLPLLTGNKYLLSQIFRAEHFNKILNSEAVAPTWVVGLFGSDGVSIARSHNPEALVGKAVNPYLFKASQQQYSGRTQHVTRDNMAVYSVFTHTARTGWTVAIGVPVDEIEGPARTAALFAAVSIALVFAVATFGVLLLARRVTLSVDGAVAAARILGEGGIPEVLPSRVAEIDMLQLALHDAGRALSSESTARQLLIKERENLLLSERLARNQADLQNKAKDEFLAMLGHELRNPLAPISAAADLLRLTRSDPERVVRTSEVITRQVKHMTGLIDDMLDVSRVTRGLVTVEKVVLSLGALLIDAIEQARPLIDARHHQLKIDIPSQPVYVLGDHKRLVQVVTNVLNNAVKYTPTNGTITLTLTVTDQLATVTVIDNGIGMTEELVERAFELFSQAVRTPDRQQGGLGLGLALVRSIVELHGGTVSAHSAGLGHGSRFTLTLPRVFGEIQSGPDATQQAEVKATKSLRVMVVDDNMDAADMLAMLIQYQGYEVTVAYESKVALDLGLATAPDIFLLDLGLPEMDGNELARALRAHPQTAGATLIAITGYGMESDKERALEAGFNHHFAKPIDAAKLIALLDEIGKGET